MNRLWTAVLAGAVGLGGLTALTRRADSQEVATAIAEPARQAPTPPEAAGPPHLPPAADHLPPVSFELVTTWQTEDGASRSTVQRVSRTPERARLELDGGRREWLFERNPAYPDRVTGYLIDHDAREILVHHDSDLRNVLALRGWADVLMMRFDPASLDGLRDTGERRELAGATFHRYEASGTPATGLVEAWWSPDLLLPLEQTVRQPGSTMVTARVRQLSATVDAAVLAPAAARFPDYELLDAADAGDHRS